MAREIKVCILGAGKIARTMARTLQGMRDAAKEGRAPAGACVPVLWAAAARDLDRARALAEEYGFARAYGSYEELARDPQAELIYIATPHSHHYEHMKLCIRYGKHILCEKAFTANSAQAGEVLDLARERGLLVTEAMWTRYMPMRRILRDVMDSGIIGRPYTLSANLCYDIDGVERLVKPSLAGGALLDVGIYPINFALMAFGNDIQDIISSAALTDEGVDGQNSITFRYKDGRQALLYSSMYCRSDRQGVISGEKGYLIVKNINNPQCITVYDAEDRVVTRYDAPSQISGYEYEVYAAMRAIEEGQTECREMPHEETMRVMELMDGLRREWGIVYPFER